MHNNKKREYTSPEMEILNARVERGFSGSNPSTDPINNPSGNDLYRLGGQLGDKFN
jgi:hypothetical protein